MINKEQILTEAKEKLAHALVLSRMESELVEASIVKLRQRLKTSASIEGKVDAFILANNLERIKQLEDVKSSPYFARCNVMMDQMEREIYFGKFQLSEANIYSWVSPIAQLRFSDIGEASYKLPSGEFKSADVSRKDQFMVVNGQIIFMSSESLDYDRTLIYQERLANKKTEFILPEIVAKMEKAQDEVIRAGHAGSFLISGPAGSGKTTLAFHRLAYLAQSPDTAKLYPGWNMIVFVQDESTRKYFSAILPQLGIEDVIVTTFEQWALEVLNIPNYKFAVRYGRTEKEKNELEYFKNQALKNYAGKLYVNNNIKTALRTIYQTFLPEKYLILLDEQLGSNTLDRFDLTLLLKQVVGQGGLTIEKRVVTEDKNGKLKLANKKVSLAYAFVVIDEAENYLADQVTIIKSCVNQNQSILYVGDLAQQTKLGTIKQWSEVGEEFGGERKVILDKVYRNTREILEYINKQGYGVNIPEAIKSGPPVREVGVANEEELKKYIDRVVVDNPDVTFGVLYNNNCEYLKNNLVSLQNANVKVLSFAESQGVEFDCVVLITSGSAQEEVCENKELQIEVNKIKRDLWYVAMTRSMNELHVLKVL